MEWEGPSAPLRRYTFPPRPTKHKHPEATRLRIGPFATARPLPTAHFPPLRFATAPPYSSASARPRRPRGKKQRAAVSCPLLDRRAAALQRTEAERQMYVRHAQPRLPRPRAAAAHVEVAATMPRCAPRDGDRTAPRPSAAAPRACSLARSALRSRPVSASFARRSLCLLIPLGRRARWSWTRSRRRPRPRARSRVSRYSPHSATDALGDRHIDDRRTRRPRAWTRASSYMWACATSSAPSGTFHCSKWRGSTPRSV